MNNNIILISALLVITYFSRARCCEMDDLVLESKSLDNYGAQRWRYLPWLDKAPYLLDKHQIVNLKQEYSSLCFQNAAQRCSCMLGDFEIKLQEFQSTNKITNFFSDCDENIDGLVTFDEYVVCRSYYDKVGNASDVSEFDVLENIVLEDYQVEMDKKLTMHLQSDLVEESQDVFLGDNTRLSEY